MHSGYEDEMSSMGYSFRNSSLELTSLALERI
jgi:hypothetical protein